MDGAVLARDARNRNVAGSGDTQQMTTTAYTHGTRIGNLGAGGWAWAVPGAYRQRR